MALVFQPLVGPDDSEKPSFSIPEGRISLSLGRSGNNDIEIDDTSVSIVHARIERDSSNGSEEFDVIDCGSSNGTFVNGTKVERHGVAAGDLVRFARVEYRIVEGDADSGSEDEQIAEVEALRQELDAAKSELKSLQDKAEAQSRDIETQMRLSTEQEEKLEKSSTEIRQLREANLQLESQIATSQFELSQRDTAIEKANRDCADAVQKCEDWQISYDELSRQLAEKSEEQIQSQRSCEESENARSALTQEVAAMTSRLLADWREWLSDEEISDEEESAEQLLERVERARQKIRGELDKIEPIWFEFGDGAQEELRRQCNDLKLEQRSLVEENRDKREVLETTEKDLAEIRSTVDEEIRRAQGLSRRGTKVTLPEGYDTMVIAKDREQAIYEELIRQIEYFDSLLTGYRKNRKLKEAVEELEDFRQRLAKILSDQGVEEFEISPGTVLTLKQRREVQILAKKGWGTREFIEQTFQPGEVAKVVRTGYRVGGDGEKGVILRKVEVLIRDTPE